MLYHEPGTRLGKDPESLHDMRVATRRMRAAMRVFGDHFEAAHRKQLVKGMRRTGRALGGVRDLDVFMGKARKYLADLPMARQHDLDLLLEYCSNQREKERKKLLAALNSAEYNDFVIDMEQFIRTPGLGSLDVQAKPFQPVLVRHVAPRMIYERYEIVRAYEGVIPYASIATLHNLRIEAKGLRYTIEFFREVLGKEAKTIIGYVVALQDHLGAIQDAEVAQELVRKTMKRLLKKTRKAQKRSMDVVDLPSLGGIMAYLEDREQLILHLQDTLPEVWVTIISEDLRRDLSLAVSVL
jgi:CHAD domain-containing protein